MKYQPHLLVIIIQNLICYHRKTMPDMKKNLKTDLKSAEKKYIEFISFCLWDRYFHKFCWPAVTAWPTECQVDERESLREKKT